MYRHSCGSLHWLLLGGKTFYLASLRAKALPAISEEFNGLRTVQSIYIKGHSERNDSMCAGTRQCGLDFAFTCFIFIFLMSKAYFSLL